MLRNKISWIVACLYSLSLPMASAADWPMFGGTIGNTLHQPAETQIGSNSVGQLQMLWATPVLGPLYKTPVTDASGVYISTNTHAYRLDKNTGAVQWETTIDQLVRECPGNPGEELPPDPIGFGSETSPAIAGDLLIFSTLPDLNTYTDFSADHKGGGFVLIVTKDGQCLKRVLVTDHTYEGVLGSPTVHDGVAYVGISGYEEQVASFPGYECCSTIGKVCAVDIASGTKKWCTSLVDADPSTPEYEESAVIDEKEITVAGISGVTVWSSAPAIDVANNQLIVTTGNAYTISSEYDPETLPEKSLPVDAFVAIDLDTGVIKDVHRVVPNDFWNVDCLEGSAGNCEFEPVGPDYDFGAGASILNVNGTDIAVAINKAANVYAVDTATLSPMWETKVGPTTLLGLAGSATDGNSVFVSNPDFFDIDFDRLPESPFIPREWTLIDCPNPDANTGCPTIYGGHLTSLDGSSGDINWQNTDPSNFEPLPDTDLGDGTLLSAFGKTPYLGPPASANGVVFQGVVYPNMFLLDDEAPGGMEELLALIFGLYPNANAAECPYPNFFMGMCQAKFTSMYAFGAGTGEIIWSFDAAGPTIAGAAIADGRVYWGALDVAAENGSVVYAFALPPSGQLEPPPVQPPGGPGPDDSGATGPTGPGPVSLSLGGGCSLTSSGTFEELKPD